MAVQGDVEIPYAIAPTPQATRTLRLRGKDEHPTKLIAGRRRAICVWAYPQD